MHKSDKKSAKKAGFTLIVVAVALLAIGIVLLSNISLETKREHDKVAETAKKLERVKRALNIYYAKNGTLPCPALRDSTLGSSGLGEAVADSGEDCSGLFSSEDKVYYGTVPVKVLNLPHEFMFDGWDNRFIYIVDRDLNDDKSTVNKTIKIKDLSGNHITGPYGEKIPEFLGVVISHGKNGAERVDGLNLAGGYNKRATNSPTLTACDRNHECENIDYQTDAEFILDKWNEEEFSTSTEYVLSNYYDDMLTYITPCPAAVPGCRMWVDASDANTINSGSPSDGNAVSDVYDKSGFGLGFSQATSTKQPIYKENIVNGNSAFSFDGTDDHLTAGDSRILDGKKKWDVFAVGYKHDVNFSGQMPLVVITAQPTSPGCLVVRNLYQLDARDDGNNVNEGYL